MAKRLSRCPVCEFTLEVTEVTCARCRTRVQGVFDSCRFCRLAPEHLTFVEIFLRCEGNFSKVEKALNLSYPTVRNKFTAALAALGLQEAEREGNGETDADRLRAAPVPEAAEYATRRRDVLERLAKGEIGAEEAAEALRTLG